MRPQTSAPYPMTRLDHLGPEVVDEVVALAGLATRTDGAAPIAEHVLLLLRRPQARLRHLLLRGPAGELAGYANLDLTDPAAGIGVELVVHPAHRGQGHGRALLAAVGAETEVPLRIWSHGDHPSAAALAVDLGFRRERMLWQLRRPLTASELPDLFAPELPEGIVLRGFRPGRDDEEWLALNARAFAEHPEQGRWTADDLRARMAEPWFDPDGFLLAVSTETGRLVGFHWTKVHDTPGGRPIGEVYVLGVDPDAHRGGLGRALTTAGLTHLRSRGLDRVMLYVDDTNAAAMALYQRLGFARWCAHVEYRRG